MNNIAQGSRITQIGGVHMPIPMNVRRSYGLKRSQRRKKSRKKWSAAITKKSDAMDLEPNVFKKRSAKAIAQSIKRSVTKSRRLKASRLKSGISMISFYINRAGKKLPAERKRTLMKAKDELRKIL